MLVKCVNLREKKIVLPQNNYICRSSARTKRDIHDSLHHLIFQWQAWFGTMIDVFTSHPMPWTRPEPELRSILVWMPLHALKNAVSALVASIALIFLHPWVNKIAPQTKLKQPYQIFNNVFIYRPVLFQDVDNNVSISHT